MPYLDIPFVTQSGEGRSIEQNAAKMINMFPVVVPEAEKGKKNFILHPTSGLSTFATNGGSAGRAILELNGVLYAVIDSNLYSCATDGTLSSLGTLSTSTGYVQITNTADELCIIDGTAGYSYRISTSTFSTITDTDFPAGAVSSCQIDGYTIVAVPNSDAFKISALNDCKTWSALNTASAEGNADNIVACYAVNRQLWLFGTRSTEIWFNSGASFPFERIEGAYAEFGCAAKYSVAKASDGLLWLARGATGGLEVVKANELQPSPVSSQAVSYQISQYTTVDDAEAFIFKEAGHEFYVLTFPTENVTHVYDITTGLWHKRASLIGATQSRWLVRQYAYFNNKHYGVIFNTGKIYEISMSTYTDAGAAITRTVQSFPLYQQNHKVSIYELIMDVEKNTGIAAGTETLSLEVSRDGGYNFDTALPVAASRLGNYTDRVIWRSLGISRNWVFRFTTSDSIKWILLGISVNAGMSSH